MDLKFVLGISYWSECIICCCKSIVLILAYKEDEDKLPAASLPYAILVIIFKSKIFCRESYCFRKRKSGTELSKFLPCKCIQNNEIKQISNAGR